MLWNGSVKDDVKNWTLNEVNGQQWIVVIWLSHLQVINLSFELSGAQQMRRVEQAQIAQI